MRSRESRYLSLAQSWRTIATATIKARETHASFEVCPRVLVIDSVTATMSAGITTKRASYHTEYQRRHGSGAITPSKICDCRKIAGKYFLSYISANFEAEKTFSEI